MDKHTMTLIIGIALAAIGAFMALNEKHFDKTSWKPTGLSKTMDPEMAKRLAKFQGVIVMCMGIGFVYLAFFG
jgi:hypothetical protein